MAFKIQPQEKTIAIQHLGALSGAMAERGTLPSTKVEFATCLQALRLVRRMNETIAMIEQNEELMTLPTKEAQALLNDIVQAGLKDPVSDDDKKTDEPPAK